MDFISLFFSHLIFSTVKKKRYMFLLTGCFQFEDSKRFHFRNKKSSES